jgi:ABC-2 type transport system permease protein
MGRYGRLLWTQLRASLLLATQYRADFFIDGFIEVLWTSTALTPLLVVFAGRTTVAGWRFGEALVVVGFFTLLQAVLEGAIKPSLTAVVEHIRKGTLDFVLLKPADAQFLVSTAHFLPWRSVNVLTAGVIFVVAFRSLGRSPTPAGIALALVLLLAAIVLLYALFLLVVSTAFRAVRIDNVSELFLAVFDAARWPSSIFQGAARVVFTFVIPLALMTTVPAQALLGVVDAPAVASAVGVSLALLAVTRWVWVRALAGYSSASS